MTGPSVTLLPAATIDDFEPFAHLHQQAFGALDEAPWSAASFRQLVESPGMEIWLAHKDGRAAGYILTRRVLDEAELISIAVDPACQQSGCGGKLLDTALAHLAVHGVKSLFLEVRADNHAALGFYDRHGFRKTGVRRGYYQTQSGKRIDALCLMLSIKHKKNKE